MTTRLQTAKAELRAQMLAQRDALSRDEMRQKSAAIAQQVQDLPSYRDARTICSYMAIGNEVATKEIVLAALSAGKRVALPRTILGERRLALQQVTSLDELIPGRYKIPEPAPDAPKVDPADVDLFLIPGAAFDTAGNRIGYGAGFYDTLLAQSQSRRYALAYAFQVVPHIPVEPHDIPVEYLVTEYGVIDCRQGQRRSDRLRLRNIQCYGHHGVYPEEREHGLRFDFDIELCLDLQLPGISDDLLRTVDYPAVAQLVDRVQSSRQYALLEALAEQIARTILQEFPTVNEVTVTVRKFHPPVGVMLDTFEVEITRARMR